MNDDNLRGRFRRDFTREPIRQTPRPTPAAPPPTPGAAFDRPVSAQATLAPVPANSGPTNASAVLPALEHIKPESRPKKVKTRRRHRKLYAAVFIIVVALAGGSLAAYKYMMQPAVPASIKSQVDIPVLYPGKLPAGFILSRSSFNVSSGNIVAYYAQNAAGDKILFTVQPRPANFDFNAFYSQSLTNATRFTTGLGEAAVGSANGRLLGSLSTNKTWVISTGSSKAVTADMIQYALTNLKTD